MSESGGYWSDVGKMLNGYFVEGPKELIMGVYTIATTNPITTAQNLSNGMGTFAGNVLYNTSDTLNDFEDSLINPNRAGKTWFNIATTVVTGGGEGVLADTELLAGDAGTLATREFEIGFVENESGMLERYLNGSGGRWGSSSTRALNDAVATTLENEGYKITGGAGRESEEFIAGAGPGSKGGTYVDVTARAEDGSIVRVQTVDTLPDGSLTKAEQAAADRIRAARPNDTLILIPKKLR